MTGLDKVCKETRWGQVVLATIAQNIATGLVFGSFGTMVLAIEQVYGVDRSRSSLALSLAVVTLSLTGALIGRWIDRIDLRSLMIAGALLIAAGFVGASFARTPTLLLCAYTVLIGPGTAMLGVLPSMTLAARWVPERLRGMALGLVNMPIAVVIVPLAVAALLPTFGLRAIYLTLAAAALATMPLMLFVRSGRGMAVAAREPAIGAAAILRRPVFWTLTVSVGLVTGAGTMKLAHFVPLLMGQGRTFADANFLLALSGGAGLVGSLAFGGLADRVGGLLAIAINAGIQAQVWTIFLAPVTMPVLVLDAVVVGACGGGLQTALGAAIAALFRPSAFGRAYSLFQFSTLPFLFGMPPLASALFERTGSYYLPMAVTICGLLFTGLLCMVLARTGWLAVDEE